jgi:hypothetical protein
MRSSGKDLPTGGIPILMSALGHELTSQRRLSWFALCQYQTLPVFGAAPDPPSEADQSRESYEPSRCTERYWRRTRPLSPGSRSWHKRLIICNGADSLSYVGGARRGALQTTVSRASMRST